jgi:pyruvate dehydrogenase E2 component (dihydrolipoamide acetyltransferase)
MAVAVVMPRQGQSVESCIITKWHKSAGDTVKEGDMLFSYETDKAAFDEEAGEGGILLEIFYREGDEVPVLENVAVIGNKGDDISGFLPAALSGQDNLTGSDKENILAGSDKNIQTANEITPAGDDNDYSVDDSATGNKRVRISPLAKRIAGEMNVPLANIRGTGPMGRIIERDIRKAAADVTAREEPPSVYKVDGSRGAADAGHPAMSGDDFTVTKLSGVRKIIAARMFESLQNSAQLTHHMSADARKLLEWRNEIKSTKGNPGHIDITINDMVCYSVVKALKKHPGINAHFLGDSIKTFTGVHLGIAVDTERGLMVPALRNADELNIGGLAGRLKDLAGQCKKGNVDLELLASGAASFTVTNLGGFGVEMFTPVLNLPQVGILGVNTIVYRPADIGNGTIGIIPVIGLSLSYDHRAIDGAPASSFLREVKSQIENIR